MKWTVIGISGITCGGKTTLVDAFVKKFPKTVVVHQDDYFYPENDPRHVKVPDMKCLNWELMSAMDMDKLRHDVQNILNRPIADNNFLIIEGFLVLNDDFLSKICEIKLFFTLPLEESKRRRAARAPQPQFPQDVPGYFDAFIRPEYQRAKEEAHQLNLDMHYIDGLKSTQDILNDLLKLLQ